MAANTESRYHCKEIGICGLSEPPSTSLQNCLKFSHGWTYLSILCDFGVAMILEITVCDGVSSASVKRRLSHGKGETLEGHAWSPDTQLYAVAGHTIYIYRVSEDFALLHKMDLYYTPKDVSLAACTVSEETNKYRMAVAGPNGVELSMLSVKESSSTLQLTELSPFHPDLAIVLVEFSPDGQYLAVAALDCHFGIWTISEDQKDFWYVHLNTVRITNIAFSPDSSKVAVACWEGFHHSYVRTSKTHTSDQDAAVPQWKEVNCDVVPTDKTSVDKFTGVLPGALASSSPDSDSFRFAYVNEKGSWVSTRSLQHDKLHSQKISTVQDHVKGICSFRCKEGDFSICLLRPKRLMLLSWSSPDTEIESDRNKPAEVLLHEDVYGSLSLTYDASNKQNAILNLVQPIAETREKLKELDALCWKGIGQEEETLYANTSIEGKQPNNGSIDAENTVSSRLTGKCESILESSSNLELTCGGIYEQCIPCPLDPTLLISSSPSSLDVSVLVSLNHVIIVRFPLVAYVWSCEDRSWRALLFEDDVIRCCVTHVKYLVTLTSNGVLRYWSLESLDLAGYTTLDVKNTSSSSLILVGSLAQRNVRVLYVDDNVDGYITTCTMRHTDNHINVSGCRCSLIRMRGRALRGSLGRLLIFSIPSTQESRTDPNSDNNEWSVVLPELNLYRDFTENRMQDVRQFVIAHERDLTKIAFL